MNLVRLCSEVSIAAVVVAFWVTGCGSSGKSDGGVPATSSSTNPNAPATDAMNGAAAGSDGTNNEGGPGGNLPLGGNAATNGDMAANAPVSPVASGAVACGGAGTFCSSPTQTCCTVPGAGGMGMGNGGNTFSCAADVASCPAGTLSAASCSSSASCGAGEACCRTPNPPPAGAMGGGNNGTTAACAAACAAGDTQLCLDDAECGAGNICNLGNNGTGTCGPAPCTASSCAAGEICCRGNGGGQGAAPACVAPTDGSCPAGRQQVCDTAADCPAGSGDTCEAPFGNGGGGVLVCTPPPCTPGSCAGADELCCVGGGGGGNPLCVASVAPVAPATTVTCPNNQRQFCAVDADCTAVPGTVCLAGANGGQLSCRPPVCTPASCAADQLCCLAQGGGALPACVTPAAPAVAGAAPACPGANGNNSRLVCETADDCAPVSTAIPGAVCAAGQNGGTVLTCRVPPPPAVPADAGP